jgi:hypothetical protein
MPDTSSLSGKFSGKIFGSARPLYESPFLVQAVNHPVVSGLRALARIVWLDGRGDPQSGILALNLSPRPTHRDSSAPYGPS